MVFAPPKAESSSGRGAEFVDFKSHAHSANYTFHDEYSQDKPRDSTCPLTISSVSAINAMSSLLLKRAVYTSLAGASIAAIYYQTRKYNTSFKGKMLPPYEANFQVPMHCDACIKDISGALSKIPGILPCLKLPGRPLW